MVQFLSVFLYLWVAFLTEKVNKGSVLYLWLLICPRSSEYKTPSLLGFVTWLWPCEYRSTFPPTRQNIVSALESYVCFSLSCFIVSKRTNTAGHSSPKKALMQHNHEKNVKGPTKHPFLKSSNTLYWTIILWSGDRLLKRHYHTSRVRLTQCGPQKCDFGLYYLLVLQMLY